MAAATAAADPPGYFVGRPLHYQEQQPQTVPSPEPPTPPPPTAPAVDDQNAVNAQVPGYYKGRVQSKPSNGGEHNINNNNASAAVQQNREPGFLAKFFGGLIRRMVLRLLCVSFECFTGSSGNAS